MLVRLPGTVCAGRGRGAQTVLRHSKPLAGLLGAAPYSGTLNVLLAEPLLLRVDRAPLRVREHAYWPVRFMGRDCLLNRWHGCPLHIVEIVASERLRDLLPEQGSLEITVACVLLAPITRAQLESWRNLWAASPASYYDDDYLAQVRSRKDKALLLSTQNVLMPRK